jgi:DNA-binding response OmpR family regulator
MVKGAKQEMFNLFVPFAADEAVTGEFRFSLIARRLVISHDRMVTLTSQEARLLALLLRSPEQIIPSEIILEEVWEYSGGKSALTSTIHRLRQKIEPDPKNPQYLQQIGDGYVIFPFLRR